MKWLSQLFEDDPGEAPKMREMSREERDWMIIQIANNTAETARQMRWIRNFLIGCLLLGDFIVGGFDIRPALDFLK